MSPFNRSTNHNTSHLNERSSSEGSNGSPADAEKARMDELETIHTNERVGSHTNYYEKGGLRTEGDGEDHVGAHNKVRMACGNMVLYSRLTSDTVGLQGMDGNSRHVLPLD